MKPGQPRRFDWQRALLSLMATLDHGPTTGVIQTCNGFMQYNATAHGRPIHFPACDVMQAPKADECDPSENGLHAIVDVTIAYPGGRPSLVDLLANRVPQIRVQVRERPIPVELLGGDYQNDRAFRVRFQQWMNALWQQKDEDLARLLGD